MNKHFLPLLLAVSLFAGMYDSPYSIVNKKANTFLDENSIEIRSFDALEFHDGRVVDTSKDNLKAIISTIKSYMESGKKVQVRVIGHTPMKRDRNTELTVNPKNENTYNVENMFRFSDPEDIEEEDSTVYASYVISKLENKNIPKEIITKEFRSTKALGLDIEKEKKINLPNQVLVILHVIAPVLEPVIVKAKEIIVPVIEPKPEPVIVKAKEIIVPVIEPKPEPVIIKVKEVITPIAVFKDSDGDKVADTLDNCPKTRSKIKVDVNGCPYDTDKDGILDYRDVCSNTPFGDAVYGNGCSIRKKLRLNFASKSTKVPAGSYSKIKKLARFLKENKEYKIKVIGHTSRTSVSNATYNLKLSKMRAKAVEKALVKYGVSKRRLTSLGKGFHEPIADNNTEDGRALNRRIEVKLFK